MSKRSVKALVALAVGAVILVLGICWFIQARTTSAVNACINNLRQIDGAIQQWALDRQATTNSFVTWNDIRPYLAREQSSPLPRCPQGGTYTIGRVVGPPRCSIMRHNLSFGYISVVDESGAPLTDTLVSVRGGDTDICLARTSPNGEAYLLRDPAVWDNVVTNSWSDGTKQIVAMKEGYHVERIALPTN